MWSVINYIPNKSLYDEILLYYWYTSSIFLKHIKSFGLPGSTINP